MKNVGKGDKIIRYVLGVLLVLAGIVVAGFIWSRFDTHCSILFLSALPSFQDLDKGKIVLSVLFPGLPPVPAGCSKI